MAKVFLPPTPWMPSPPLAMAGRAARVLSPTQDLPSPSETIGAASGIPTPMEGVPHPHIMSRATCRMAPAPQLPGSSHIVPATCPLSPTWGLPGPDYTCRATMRLSPIAPLRGSHFSGWAIMPPSPAFVLPSPLTPQGEPQWT